MSALYSSCRSPCDRKSSYCSVHKFTHVVCCLNGVHVSHEILLLSCPETHQSHVLFFTGCVASMCHLKLVIPVSVNRCSLFLRPYGVHMAPKILLFSARGFICSFVAPVASFWYVKSSYFSVWNSRRLTLGPYHGSH